ncbi:SDR family NAD(P)-dependent oxidoreductase [Corticibacterium sp. UT-5YL-CI-8]|nr:SDR family NAD(P)-dependent oxidoreductase [Tianweitania sp. UT-5YL-CI-8]
MRMQNSIGLVTAAASGMGRAGAVRFAKEGAAVAIVDIDAKGVEDAVEAIKAAGGKAIGITGDLTDDRFSKEIVAETVRTFGGLDFVWAHAGHPGPSALEGMDMALFDLAVDLNLRSMTLTTGAALPEMRKRGKGSILYTSSTSGVRGSPHSPIYSAMKFGVIGFARSLAKRVAHENIRSNVICPGGVDTPMLRTFLARPDDKKKSAVPMNDLLEDRARRSPMGRTCQPEEIANAALFLLSDEASYVSGAVLVVDGAMVA